MDQGVWRSSSSVVQQLHESIKDTADDVCLFFLLMWRNGRRIGLRSRRHMSCKFKSCHEHCRDLFAVISRRSTRGASGSNPLFFDFVAQWLEHPPVTREVVGSNPIRVAGLSSGALNQILFTLLSNTMIKLQRPSSCAQLYITPDNGVVTVQFKNGTTQTFTDVNKTDIENLLNDTTISVGKFVNQVLLGRRVDVDAQLVTA